MQEGQKSAIDDQKHIHASDIFSDCLAGSSYCAHAAGQSGVTFPYNQHALENSFILFRDLWHLGISE